MTTETQLAFFAQYYGQRIMKNRNLDNTTSMNMSFQVTLSEYVAKNTSLFYLQLREISDITDAERIELYDYLLPSYKHESYDKKMQTIDNILLFKNHMGATNIYDFLRQKAFLVPFRNIPIDEILTLGWAKTN